jgi:hypothetical protein
MWILTKTRLTNYCYWSKTKLKKTFYPNTFWKIKRRMKMQKIELLFPVEYFENLAAIIEQ